MLEVYDKDDFLNSNIHKLLKPKERFKVEENLPKLDFTMEGIFYDEDFHVPEFIHVPKKKKKAALLEELEIEKHPFIGLQISLYAVNILKIIGFL